MSKKIILISFLTLALLGLSAILITRSASYQKLRCERQGGAWEQTKFQNDDLRRCAPKNLKDFVSSNLLGIKMDSPERSVGDVATLSQREGNSFKGLIKNKYYPEHNTKWVNINLNAFLEFGENAFLAPITVESDNFSHNYIGLFVVPDAIKGINIILADQYYLGDDLAVSQITALRPENFPTINGGYFAPFSVTYQEEGSGLVKSKRFRFSSETKKLEHHPACEEFGKLETRQRGDGQEYQVCVWNNGNECALDTYEAGYCSIYGQDVSQAKNDLEKYGLGQGFYFKNGEFVFPGELSECTIEDFYQGRCLK